MTITTATLIHFSPTGTTKNALQAIARGLQAPEVRPIDLTPPGAILQAYPTDFGDIALIGGPVYGGRLPAAMVPRLRQLKGNGTPAVIVVVYGNRAYEDALLELRDIAVDAGFLPIAAAAFIGEHSFSSPETPIAVGRPDAADMRNAEEFGKAVRKKLERMAMKPGDVAPIPVPGNFPYKEVQLLSDVTAAIDETLCLRCKACVPLCPTAAIDATHPTDTDAAACIRCCACVKNCPAGARR